MDLERGLILKDNSKNKSGYLVLTSKKENDLYHFTGFYDPKFTPIEELREVVGGNFSLEEIKERVIFKKWELIEDKEFKKIKRMFEYHEKKKSFPFVGDLKRIGLVEGSKELYNRL